MYRGIYVHMHCVMRFICSYAYRMWRLLTFCSIHSLLPFYNFFLLILEKKQELERE